MGTLQVRRHGWSGDLPADDQEAVRRILAATRERIDAGDENPGITDVARDLGVTRQTVYRYFRTTDDLVKATAIDASAAFLQRVEDHLAGRVWSPEGVVVEGVAFTLEQLPREPYLRMLLGPSRIGVLSAGFTSPTALALGRGLVERFPVDWPAAGYGEGDLDELVEHMLRVTQSFVVDAGAPPRSGADLRRYLTRWLAPAITVRSPTR